MFVLYIKHDIHMCSYVHCNEQASLRAKANDEKRRKSFDDVNKRAFLHPYVHCTVIIAYACALILVQDVSFVYFSTSILDDVELSTYLHTDTHSNLYICIPFAKKNT